MKLKRGALLITTRYLLLYWYAIIVRLFGIHKAGTGVVSSQ